MDLTPHLVEQEKVSMQFEQGLLESITSLRTQWSNALANGSVNDQVNVTSELAVRMGSFLSVIESNPYLQSVEVLRDIIVELEWTQNRIAAARTFLNMP